MKKRDWYEEIYKLRIDGRYKSWIERGEKSKEKMMKRNMYRMGCVKRL